MIAGMPGRALIGDSVIFSGVNCTGVGNPTTREMERHFYLARVGGILSETRNEQRFVSVAQIARGRID